MCEVNQQANTKESYVDRVAKESAWMQQQQNQQAGMQGMAGDLANARRSVRLLYDLRNERAKLSQELSNTERLIKWLEMNPDAQLMIELLRDRSKGANGSDNYMSGFKESDLRRGV